MKSSLFAALIVFAGSQVFAQESVLTYVCGSRTNPNGGATVQVINGQYVQFFIQSYQAVSPYNLLGQGTLDSKNSSSSNQGTRILVFTNLKDANQNPIPVTTAYSIDVVVNSNSQVTGISLIRAGVPEQQNVFNYDVNCQVNDASK